ncbi:hypothetical protein GCM10011418_22820 [Sphingobacterium alkalisoli]|nr:hypothetical protein GCM10011418_22820 [Sphingobacterium alkalisoli]
MTKNIQKVNGLVVGIGHFQEPDHVQTINGVNLDVMVFSPLITVLAVMHGRVYDYPQDEKTKVVSNGLNLAIGGYMGDVEHNGLSVALYNIANKSTGLGIHPAFNLTEKSVGTHISAFVNAGKYSQGLNVALYNRHEYMTGVQIGVINKSLHLKGIQIGLFNRSKTLKGLQLGFINSNGKRTLPFINF